MIRRGGIAANYRWTIRLGENGQDTQHLPWNPVFSQVTRLTVDPFIQVVLVVPICETQT